MLMQKADTTIKNKFHIAGWGGIQDRDVEVTYLFQNNKLYVTVLGVSEDYIEKVALLQFLQTEGVIKNTQEWRIIKVDDADGLTFCDEAFVTLTLKRRPRDENNCMEELEKLIDSINRDFKKIKEETDPAQRLALLLDFEGIGPDVKIAILECVHQANLEMKGIVLTPAPEKKSEKRQPHEERKETMKLMKKIRKQGATYKEIAQFLNNKNVPTFSGKGGWHAQSVHRLLDKKKRK